MQNSDTPQVVRATFQHANLHSWFGHHLERAAELSCDDLDVSIGQASDAVVAHRH